MNHIYRSIWNDALGTWVAVSELAKSTGKTSVSAKKVASPLLATGLLAFSSSVWSLPTGNQLVAGQATVATPTATQMQINQTSNRAVINWQDFSVQQNEAVNIQQPHQQAALLNRVVGQNASTIQGKIQSNGQVYLVNPNGVVFNKTAQVDVGGLVASTHDVSDADFMAGRNHFTQSRQGTKVENQGTISTAKGGVVALIGEQVVNSGTINTPKGTSALAAGKTVDLDFKGDGLVEVKVSEAALNAQLHNHGAISADGGRVVLSAKSANALMDTVVNQNGIIKAQGLVERNGEIILEGGDNGTVKISGELDAQSTQSNGGTIQVKGNHIELESTAKLNVSNSNTLNSNLALNLNGGNIHIGDKQSTQTVTLKQGSTVKANANNGNAGHIDVLAKMDTGLVNVQGVIEANVSTQGNGGFVDTSAAKVKVDNAAKISTKTTKGQQGKWLIDPFDFTIGTDITGVALSAALSSNNVMIQSGTISCVGTVCGSGSLGNGDIFVNEVVNWAANKLTLSAFRNININADLNASNTAQLALEYGQGAVAAGNTSHYAVHAAVNLPQGDNFSTKLGSDGSVVNYSVITQLGAENSATASDLQGMQGALLGNYVLGADIDASATGSWNLSGAVYQGFKPIGDLSNPFKGRLEGLGHVISGLTINRSSSNNVGLFGAVDSAIIQNLGLVNVDIIGLSHVGSLTGNEIGAGGTVSNVYALGKVSGENQLGGLIGFNKSSINNSYASVDVVGKTDLGGLVGQNWGSINNAYATGKVSSSSSGVIGGLLGSNYAGNVEHTYASGLLNGGTSMVGSLVGAAFGGSVSNSFWDQSIVPSTGVIGSGGILTNVLGKTTADLMTQSTYSGVTWDFANTWWMIEGETRPYLQMEYNTNIATTHQLQLMAKNLAADYHLVTDLYFNANPSLLNKGFVPVGNSAAPFTGTFDGQYHNIDGLFINRPNTDYVGLFGYTDNGSSISNVNLSNVAITGRSNVGALVGYSQYQQYSPGSSIANSYVQGVVTGTGASVGGLIGYNYSALDNVFANVMVTGVNGVGGLAGGHQGTINNAGAIGNVIASAISGMAGGLVGATCGCANYSAPISNSYAMGNVTADIAGGLVGYNFWTAIQQTYATGNVIARIYGGGLVGQQLQAAINDSYATGHVSGTGLLGGLVGLNDGASIDNTYASGVVSGTGTLGGLVASNVNGSTISDSFWNIGTSTSSLNLVGFNDSAVINSATQTNANMMKMATFDNVGWSIDNTGSNPSVWRIYENQTSPLLRYWLKPLTIVPSNTSKTYNGLADTQLQATYLDAVNNPLIPDVEHLFNTTNPYNGAKDVGTYSIVNTPYSDQQGYNIVFNNAALLNILPAVLTVAPEFQSIVYGDAIPTHFTPVITGFVNGETASNIDLTGTATFNPQGYTGDVGSYNLSYNTGLSSRNYLFIDNVNIINELSVTPATLSVSPNSQSLIYGSPISFTPSFTGFVNGENAATAGITGNALFNNYSVNVGTYNVSYASGLTSQNYIFTDNSASNNELTITPKTLYVSPTIQHLINGAKPRPFRANFRGFISGDTLLTAGITGHPEFEIKDFTGKTGKYDVNYAGGLSSQNYIFANDTLSLNELIIDSLSATSELMQSQLSPLSSETTYTFQPEEAVKETMGLISVKNEGLKLPNKTHRVISLFLSCAQ